MTWRYRRISTRRVCVRKLGGVLISNMSQNGIVQFSLTGGNGVAHDGLVSTVVAERIYATSL
jgi:hypothetical protein